MLVLAPGYSRNWEVWPDGWVYLCEIYTYSKCRKSRHAEVGRGSRGIWRLGVVRVWVWFLAGFSFIVGLIVLFLLMLAVLSMDTIFYTSVCCFSTASLFLSFCLLSLYCMAYNLP